jgi:hypothetical protein
MPDRDRNVIDLNARRAQDAARRKAEDAARKSAQRAAASRRRLAEHGPLANHAGSVIGRILALLVAVIAVGSIVALVAERFVQHG